jgi:hypothetical protein
MLALVTCVNRTLPALPKMKGLPTLAPGDSYLPQ